jgi:hypothetical protein
MGVVVSGFNPCMEVIGQLPSNKQQQQHLKYSLLYVHE